MRNVHCNFDVMYTQVLEFLTHTIMNCFFVTSMHAHMKLEQLKVSKVQSVYYTRVSMSSMDISLLTSCRFNYNLYENMRHRPWVVVQVFSLGRFVALAFTTLCISTIQILSSYSPNIAVHNNL